MCSLAPSSPLSAGTTMPEAARSAAMPQIRVAVRSCTAPGKAPDSHTTGVAMTARRYRTPAANGTDNGIPSRPGHSIPAGEPASS